MTPDHDTHPIDDLAVYAVDALDPPERAAVEAHLAGCAACRHELDLHRATLGAMAVPEEPPADLWGGISRQIHAGAADDPLRPGLETREVVVVPLPPPAPDATPLGEEPRPRHRARGYRPEAWWRSGRVLAAAAAVVVVLGVGAVVVGLPGDEPSPSVPELAADAAADPQSTLVTLSSAAGEPAARVVLADDADFDDDFVVFDDLPALDAEGTYQLWRTDQGPPVSLGLLGDGADGAAEVSLPQGVAGFAISREPAGGSPSPTDVVAT